jgi:hypothetical protein
VADGGGLEPGEKELEAHAKWKTGEVEEVEK